MTWTVSSDIILLIGFVMMIIGGYVWGGFFLVMGGMLIFWMGIADIEKEES